MTKRFIEVDANDFEDFLKSKGFARAIQKEEIVYVMQHKRHPYLYIKVYTSLGVGDDVARECGSDCIRIVAIFDNGRKSFGLYKGQRVYRTGSQEKVKERTLVRMRESYARCNEWMKNNIKDH